MILFYLFIAFILSPKIDLVSIGDNAIRPEDFITALAVGLLAVMRRRVPFSLSPAVKAYLVVVGLNFVAAALNFGSEGVLPIVAAVRLLEYLAWYFILYEAAAHLRYRSARNALLFAAVVLILWGWGEFFGVIPKIGRFASVESRLSINTSGPFEASMVLAVLAYAVQQIVTTPVLAALTWLTQARITIVAAIVALLTRNPVKSLPIIAVVGVVALLFASPIAALLGESRFADAASPVGMFEFLSRTYQRAATFEKPVYFRQQFASSLEGFAAYFDMRDPGASFNLRAVRWSIVVKSTLTNFDKMWFGFGPGAFGVALDGFYFRAIGETGLVGFAALIGWIVITLRTVHRRSIASFQFTMMIVVALFIDIFTSSKVMPMLWGFLALEHARHPHALPSTPKLVSQWYDRIARTALSRGKASVPA